jgi:hypothetical protein
MKALITALIAGFLIIFWTFVAAMILIYCRF